MFRGRTGKHPFGIVLNGYDQSQVDARLDALQSTLEAARSVAEDLDARNRALEEQLRGAAAPGPAPEAFLAALVTACERLAAQSVDDGVRVRYEQAAADLRALPPDASASLVAQLALAP